MKKKKKVIIIIASILIVGIAGLVYYFLNKEDEDTTLSLIERKWIENNKDKMIDLAVLNNVPIFGLEGKGIFFNFINDFEDDTELEFNKIAYNLDGDSSSAYAFKVTNTLEKNDYLLYKDNYVIVAKEKIKINNLSELNNLKIGVVSEDASSVAKYLDNNSSLSYQTYENVTTLLNDFQGTIVVTEDDSENDNSKVQTTGGEIDAIVIPKTLYLNQILSNENNHIIYQIEEMPKYIVLQLDENNEKLNDILTKYLDRWLENNFDGSFSSSFREIYFNSKKVEEKEKANFKGKRYVYGFVSNYPFDTTIDKKIYGINSIYIKDFAEMSDSEISFKKYDNNKDLINAFNKNEIDFMLNNVYSNENYQTDTYETIPVYNSEVVLTSNYSNDLIVNSLASLENKTVKVVKNSKIANYLENNNINVKTVNEYEDLKNVKNNEIIALDKLAYDYYGNKIYSRNKIDYIFKLPEQYNFIIRNVEDNKVFIDFFDFYLSITNHQAMENKGINELLTLTSKPSFIRNLSEYIIYIIIGFVVIIIIGSQLLKRKKKKKKISKVTKLRYVDQLTSLKNRNYLNDHIEEWDENEIYPQALIVADLNNIKYINDNYGHAEGDNIIKSAASILINNQQANSEIMRTNGNEFLIYAVGMDEKQVISYTRKLTKEFKNLAHGFGAAIGYSMIVDEIKTIDDAINEATLDMRTNKENSRE